MSNSDILTIVNGEIEVALAIKNLVLKQIKYNLTSINSQINFMVSASPTGEPIWAKTSSSYPIVSAAQDLSKFEAQIKTIDLMLQSLNKIKSLIEGGSANNKVVAVSGGFDPIHTGHIRMIKEAAKLGSVVVIANSDDWLNRKKGYCFMGEKERVEILSSLSSVSSVIIADDSDDTVCKSLEKLKPDIFANGGDRTNKNVPEKALCEKLGIEMAWGIGGKKIQSSSDLVKKGPLKKSI